MRILMLVWGMLAWAVAVHAADFTQTMSPEERKATGLDRLTPAELQQLKAIVERYKSGEVAVVQQQAEQKVAVVRQEAEQKVAVAEAKVKAVEAKVTTPESGKKQPGWISALLTLQKATEKPDEVEVFEDRLAGELKSFEGKRRFTLQSGQVWEMIQGDYYSGPTIASPAVTVKPGILGVYWLRIEEAKLRVKVKLIRIE